MFIPLEHFFSTQDNVLVLRKAWQFIFLWFRFSVCLSFFPFILILSLQNTGKSTKIKRNIGLKWVNEFHIAICILFLSINRLFWVDRSAECYDISQNFVFLQKNYFTAGFRKVMGQSANFCFPQCQISIKFEFVFLLFKGVSRFQRFVARVKGFPSLNIVAKQSILDICRNPGYAFASLYINLLVSGVH